MNRSYRYASQRAKISCGSPFNKEYKTVIKDGAEEIECVGEIPLDDLIQADADSCRIGSIIRRFCAGDASALNARAASYLDLTEAPSNLMEAQAQLKRAQNYFDGLPAEVKKDYNFDFSAFLAASSDGSFVTKHGEAVGILKPKTVQETPKEVI